MLQRHSIILKPQLSKRAFWDTNLAALDFKRYEKFIIIRVFERGDKNDQLAILNYYGEKTIIETLTNAESLLPIARERAKRNFHLSDQDFACFRSKRPARNLSNIKEAYGYARAFSVPTCWWNSLKLIERTQNICRY